MKTPGVFSLHRLAAFILRVCDKEGLPFSAASFRRILSDLDPDFLSGEFWKSDNTKNGAAAYGSMKGFAVLTDMMQAALFDKGWDDDNED
jgi:uncharacterized UPF0160 family protein